MKISDKIYVNLNKEPVPDEILDLLTYENPDYHQKKNMGLWVGNIPQQITTYTIKDHVLAIQRGEALKVKKYIYKYAYEFEHPNHPVSLQYINDDFDLDEYQEGAINAIQTKKQGIIHAVTSAGKSLIILKAIVKLGQRAVIIVHRKTLMEQFLQDIKKYIRDEQGQPITPGIIGNGSNTTGPITIAIDKTLNNNLERYKDYFGSVFLDECHLAPANTISNLINSINSKYRFGVSGTLKRKDQKEFLIFSTFGGIIYTIGKDVLLAKGRVVPVHIKIIETETQFNWDSAVEGFTEQGHKNPTQAARLLQEKTIMLDERRNQLILELVSKLKGKQLVLCRYVDPCYSLQKALKEQFGLDSGVITGRDGKEAIETYNAMKHGDLQIIFATVGCVSTGVSISDIDHIVLISPIFTNELLLHQIRGRGMRTAEGKEFCLLHFLYDQFIFPPWKLSKFLQIMKK